MINVYAAWTSHMTAMLCHSRFPIGCYDLKVKHLNKCCKMMRQHHSRLFKMSVMHQGVPITIFIQIDMQYLFECSSRY